MSFAASSNSWELRPGDAGFNNLARKKLEELGFLPKSMGGTLETKCSSYKEEINAFAHTQVPAFLCGPSTPCNRMLIVHKTGSGKTSIMVHVLDQYEKVRDPRPRVCIFPTLAVKNNFYMQLSNSHTLYNQRLEVEGVRTLQQVEDVLRMNRKLRQAGLPGELSAPLRAVTYSRAGGVWAFGDQRDAMLNLPEKSENPFDNKIILLDEAHNIVNSKADDRVLLRRLKNLQKALFHAKNSVLIAFTATPIESASRLDDGRKLLDVIKGSEAALRAANDEGFVSYFMANPLSIYPKVLPSPHSMRAVWVPLTGMALEVYHYKHNRALRRYTPQQLRSKVGADRFGSTSLEIEEILRTNTELRTQFYKDLYRLSAYCNIAGFYTHINKKDKDLFKGLHGEEPASVAPKLLRMVEDIVDRRSLKGLVLIRKRAGMDALKVLLQRHALSDPDWLVTRASNAPNVERDMKEHGARLPERVRKRRGFRHLAVFLQSDDSDAEHTRILTAFNSEANTHGEYIRLLVVDPELYKEGTEFKAVRVLYLANPPESYADIKQLQGRTLRACSFQDLNPIDRTLEYRVYIASLPNQSEDAPPTTADELLMENLSVDVSTVNDEMRTLFGNNAVDSGFYELE